VDHSSPSAPEVRTLFPEPPISAVIFSPAAADRARPAERPASGRFARRLHSSLPDGRCEQADPTAALRSQAGSEIRDVWHGPETAGGYRAGQAMAPAYTEVISTATVL
jgi:hypothetical protein